MHEPYSSNKHRQHDFELAEMHSDNVDSANRKRRRRVGPELIVFRDPRSRAESDSEWSDTSVSSGDSDFRPQDTTDSSNGSSAEGGFVREESIEKSAGEDVEVKLESEDDRSSTESVAPPPNKKKPTRKRKKLSEKDKIPLTLKHFMRVNDELKAQHPELVGVFERLAEAPTPKTEPIEQPAELKCTLLPFQREGLNWLLKQEQSVYRGGILADEMGMGKTIQTIALILSTKKEDRLGPILIIAPTVAVMQWRNEIAEYAGDHLKVLVYHGANRSNNIEELKESDIIITTYAVCESVWRKQQTGFTRKQRKVHEKSALHNMYFHRIVLDEAHNIKDRQASTSRAIFMLQARYRLCLSGTPLQNRIGELYSLLRFMRVEPFCKYFCSKCHCNSHEWITNRQRCLQCGHIVMQHVNYFNHSLLKPIQRIPSLKAEAMCNMRRLLDHIMLRRTKVERADDLGLPPRVVNVRRDFFNEEEKDLYTSVFTDSYRQFSTYVNQGVVLNNYANIFTLITRMRQIADHPDLVLRKAVPTDGEGPGVEALICRLCDDEAEDAIESRCHHIFCRLCIQEYVGGFTGDEKELECPVCHIGLTIDLTAPAIEVDQQINEKASIVNRIRMDNTWRSSTKIEGLLEELFRLRSNMQTVKSIVFSQFTSMLDLVEWRLARAGFQTVKLHGSMSPTQRDSIIKHFMSTPAVEVFLVSLKAGGVALNLCEASQVFLLEPWWNPSVEWQSGDRVHRIGQHRPVTITRLIIEDSIESRIIELQEKKANMINATIGADNAALDRLSEGDMEFLFQN